MADPRVGDPMDRALLQIEDKFALKASGYVVVISEL
jgi:hypothetical protein